MKDDVEKSSEMDSVLENIPFPANISQNCLNIKSLSIIIFYLSRIKIHLNLTRKGVLKSDSHLPKKSYFLRWKPFKNDEKCFILKIFKFFHDFLVMLKKRLD